MKERKVARISTCIAAISSLIMFCLCIALVSTNHLSSPEAGTTILLLVTFIFPLAIGAILSGIVFSDENDYNSLKSPTKQSKKNDNIDVIEGIVRLKELLDKEIITQEEYEEKKKQLIGM